MPPHLQLPAQRPQLLLKALDATLVGRALLALQQPQLLPAHASWLAGAALPLSLAPAAARIGCVGTLLLLLLGGWP